MPRKRRKAIPRRGELSEPQFWELVLGPPGPDSEAFSSPYPRRRSAFESPFTRRAAFELNKEEIMEWGIPGQRSWAFWEYIAGEHPRREGLKVVPNPYSSAGSWKYDVYESDEDALRRLNLLEPWEEAQLSAWAAIRKGA